MTNTVHKIYGQSSSVGTLNYSPIGQGVPSAMFLTLTFPKGKPNSPEVLDYFPCSALLLWTFSRNAQIPVSTECLSEPCRVLWCSLCSDTTARTGGVSADSNPGCKNSCRDPVQSCGSGSNLLVL